MHHIVLKWPLCTYAKMWWMSRMMTFCDCAQNHRARTADGKCKVEDARTTNFNAYASVHGNYAQHFGRNTALRYPLVNMSISIVSSTLLEGRNFRKQLFQEYARKFNWTSSSTMRQKWHIMRCNWGQLSSRLREIFENRNSNLENDLDGYESTLYTTKMIHDSDSNEVASILEVEVICWSFMWN